MNNSIKARIAAKAIDANKTDEGWVYFDDSTRKYYLCETEEEMAELYDFQQDEDEDVSRDAYSHWCAGTSHEECDEDGDLI